MKTRIWDEASGEYNFTKQGDTFYKEIYRNYVVQVPVTSVGKRANGTQYTISSQLPLEKLGLTRKTLPLNLTHKQRLAKIKDMVEDELPLGTLMEHSEEKYTLDRNGAWAIHEETVGPDPVGEGATCTVILSRRLGTLEWSDLLMCEHFCAEAYERRGDMSCVPGQIAAVLKRDLGEVEADLSAMDRALHGADTWQDQGCTPEMLLKYCRMHDLG